MSLCRIRVKSSESGKNVLVGLILQVALKRICALIERPIEGSAIFFKQVEVSLTRLILRQLKHESRELITAHFVVDFKLCFGISRQFHNHGLHANIRAVSTPVDLNHTSPARCFLKLLMQVLDLSFELGDVFSDLRILLLHVLHVVPQWRSLVTEVVKQMLLGVLW